MDEGGSGIQKWLVRHYTLNTKQHMSHHYTSRPGGIELKDWRSDEQGWQPQRAANQRASVTTSLDQKARLAPSHSLPQTGSDMITVSKPIVSIATIP
jgi:hypothetical protein